MTLCSGKIHTADAIIGTDGINGVVCQTLMKEEGKSSGSDISKGIGVCSNCQPSLYKMKNAAQLSQMSIIQSSCSKSSTTLQQ
jgi:hypothetical protein